MSGSKPNMNAARTERDLLMAQADLLEQCHTSYATRTGAGRAELLGNLMMMHMLHVVSSVLPPAVLKHEYGSPPETERQRLLVQIDHDVSAYADAMVGPHADATKAIACVDRVSETCARLDVEAPAYELGLMKQMAGLLTNAHDRSADEEHELVRRRFKAVGLSHTAFRV